jgi:putative tricarboxylic transport membrane protein
MFYCLAGVFLGTSVSAIHYGAKYGGSTIALLVNLPGESSSVVPAIDDYQMARKGFAGKALATAAIGSFVAGCVSTPILALFAPALAEMALCFGPAEYFSLMVFGLVASVVLAHGSLLNAIGMIILGLLLGLESTEVNSGAARYTFGSPDLMGGLNFVVVVVMVMFGVGEIINNLEHTESRSLTAMKI